MVATSTAKAMIRSGMVDRSVRRAGETVCNRFGSVSRKRNFSYLVTARRWGSMEQATINLLMYPTKWRRHEEC